MRRSWRTQLDWLRTHHLPRPARQLVRLVALGLVVEYLLVPQIAGTRNSWHLLVGADPLWLLASLGAEALSLAAYALLTQRLMPVGHRPSYGRVLRIDLATLAVSHVVPAGSAAGLGLGYQLLTSAGVPGPEAAAAKATQAVGSAVVLNVILWIALASSIALHGFTPVYGPVALVGVVVLTVAAGLVIGMRTRRGQISGWLGRTLGRLPFLDGDRVRAAICDAADYLDAFTADRRLLAQTSVLAAVNWILDALALWAAVRAFGHSLGPDGALVPYGIANVLAAIPVTPGGLGVVEAVLIPALVGFSVPRGIAILGVLAWRAVSFVLPIPIGLLAYLGLPTSRPRGGAPSTTPIPQSTTPPRAGN